METFTLCTVVYWHKDPAHFQTSSTGKVSSEIYLVWIASSLGSPVCFYTGHVHVLQGWREWLTQTKKIISKTKAIYQSQQINYIYPYIYWTSPKSHLKYYSRISVHYDSYPVMIVDDFFNEWCFARAPCTAYNNLNKTGLQKFLITYGNS